MLLKYFIALSTLQMLLPRFFFFLDPYDGIAILQVKKWRQNLGDFRGSASMWVQVFFLPVGSCSSQYTTCWFSPGIYLSVANETPVLYVSSIQTLFCLLLYRLCMSSLVTTQICEFPNASLHFMLSLFHGLSIYFADTDKAYALIKHILLFYTGKNKTGSLNE